MELKQWKAMMEKKIMKISSIETKESVIVSIENNGKQIPKDVLNKIFEKFYSSKIGSNSSGLGLSIVSNIISEHDAEINVSSSEFSTIFAISFKKIQNE